MAQRADQPDGSRRSEPFRFWPVFALLPIIVVGQVKATGFVSIGGVDTTLLSVAFLLAATSVTFLRYPRYPVQTDASLLPVRLVVLLGVARSDPGEYQVLKARDFFLLTGVVVVLRPRSPARYS